MFIIYILNKMLKSAFYPIKKNYHDCVCVILEVMAKQNCYSIYVCRGYCQEIMHSHLRFLILNHKSKDKFKNVVIKYNIQYINRVESLPIERLLNDNPYGSHIYVQGFDFDSNLNYSKEVQSQHVYSQCIQ